MPEVGEHVVNRPCRRRYAAAACSRRSYSYSLTPPATSAPVSAVDWDKADYGRAELDELGAW